DRVAVRTRTGALRRVDDEIAAATADEVDDRRADAFLGHAAHTLDVETRGLKGRRGPFGGNEPEAKPGERRRYRHQGCLVRVAHREEYRAGVRQPPSRRALCLR